MKKLVIAIAVLLVVGPPLALLLAAGPTQPYARGTGARLAFHGDFTSADASGPTESAARIALYDDTGTAITLASTDRVLITDIYVLPSSATPVFKIFDGADATVDAGELIHWTKSAVQLSLSLQTPHPCKVGTYPKVIASASGQIDVMIRGVIDRN